MIEINPLGAILGMSIVSIGIAIIWFLGKKAEKQAKRTKSSSHSKH